MFRHARTFRTSATFLQPRKRLAQLHSLRSPTLIPSGVVGRATRKMSNSSGIDNKTSRVVTGGFAYLFGISLPVLFNIFNHREEEEKEADITWIEKYLDKCREMEEKKLLNKDLDDTSLSLVNAAYPTSTMPLAVAFFELVQLRDQLQSAKEFCDGAESETKKQKTLVKISEYLRRVDAYLILVRTDDKFDSQWVRYRHELETEKLQNAADRHARAMESAAKQQARATSLAAGAAIYAALNMK